MSCRIPWLVLLLGGLLSLPAQANDIGEERPSAEDQLEQLLESVRERRAREAQHDREREARFMEERDRREAMLDQAREALAAEERRAEQLRAQFTANEDELRELQGQLRDRMGELGEIFGVVRQVAGDTRSLTENSLVSAQLGSRAPALERLADARELPAIEDMEALQGLLLREMHESGRVARFEAPLIRPDGREEIAEVVRVGVFGAVSEGRYLNWLPGSARLAEMPAQPRWRYRRMAARLIEAGEGAHPMAVDPSRGELLGRLVDSPGLLDRIRQGRLVGVIIILLGLIGGALAVRRWWFLQRTARAMQAQRARPDEPRADNPLGRVLAVARKHADVDTETLELKLDEAIIQETPALERGLASLRILAAVAPLLGLLGTVVGMIATFQAITLFGTGDPRLMADGISQALVTTVMGLVVAIPLVLVHSFLSGRSGELVDMLEQQSAGLMARRGDKGDGS